MSLKEDIKKFFNEISKRHAYVHGDKGILEKPHKSLKQKKPEKGIGKVGRIAGLATIDLSWFLFCLMKYTAKDLHTIFLDNRWIDKLKTKKEKTEIKEDDSWFKKLFKKFQKSNPRAAATMHLWMLYALITTMTVGGVKVKNHSEDIKQTVKEWFKKDKQDDEEGLVEVYKTYDPTSDSFREDFLNENWAEIVASLLEFETYRTIPKTHSGEKRQTYGPGLTWVYENGGQKKCLGEYSNKASNFSDEQIWDQVRQHCLYQGECLSKIQRELKKYGFENVTSNQILALFVEGYQTPARLADGTVEVIENGIKKKVHYDGTIHKLSQAGDDIQKIVDSFIPGIEIPNIYIEGTSKRRWWCAMYYIGKVNANDFLGMDMDAFSEIDINTIKKGKHFVYDDSTVEYALTLKNTKVNNPVTVQNFIDTHPVLTGIDKNISKTKHFREPKRDNPSMEQMRLGLAAYNSKNYGDAIKYYTKAIELDGDNMEAYSSLVLTYIRFGDTTHNMSDYENAVKIFKKYIDRFDKNKDLIYDTDIAAAAYFNAGIAYENIAKLQLESGNEKAAIKNYKDAKYSFEKAKENKSKKVYSNAIDRTDKALREMEKNKVALFNNGIKNIHNLENSQLKQLNGNEYFA